MAATRDHAARSRSRYGALFSRKPSSDGNCLSGARVECGEAIVDEPGQLLAKQVVLLRLADEDHAFLSPDLLAPFRHHIDSSLSLLELQNRNPAVLSIPFASNEGVQTVHRSH